MGHVQPGTWKGLLVQLTNVSAVVTLKKYHPVEKKAFESEKIRASENLQSLWHWLITVKLS